ncbi:MAG: SAM-dependent methyltransferase [Thermomicrobiales bacterium]
MIAGPPLDSAAAESPTPSDNPALVAAIRAAIDANHGRITFAEFMDLALYHPEWGYYRSPQRRPGRPGDFLTAPETHPFFGITLARQIAECWERLGRPAPFVVREYGSGIGGLAWDIIAGLSAEAPESLAALDYRMVESNPYRLEEALTAMTEGGLGHLVRGEPSPRGEPLTPITGVVLANEVADAFPVHRLIWRGGELREEWVDWRDDHFAGEEGDLSPAAAAADPANMLRAHGLALAEGDRIEISPAAAAWFIAAARGLERGYAIVIDYGYPAPELYRGHRLGGTLRAYYQHTVSDDPFAHVGAQDLTAHVDFSAVRAAGERAGLTFAGQTTQGAFLASLDMGNLLVAFGADPETTLPDYLAAQAATLRLIDPGGMGRFGVLIMARDAPVSPPLRGLTVPPLSF